MPEPSGKVISANLRVILIPGGSLVPARWSLTPPGWLRSCPGTPGRRGAALTGVCCLGVNLTGELETPLPVPLVPRSFLLWFPSQLLFPVRFHHFPSSKKHNERRRARAAALPSPHLLFPQLPGSLVWVWGLSPFWSGEAWGELAAGGAQFLLSRL